MRALGLMVLALAACSAPDQLILPGKVDLAVAPGDRIRLCAEDGLKDTTPDADCVQTEREHPMEVYSQALKALGWAQVEAEAGRETWTLDAGEACRRVVIDGGRDGFARKRYSLLRFETGSCGQGTVTAEPAAAPR